MNTAARMESTGMPRRVQCSQATAELLRDAGKVGWIESREDTVHARGKGELSTFWVTLKVSKGPSSGTGSGTGSGTTSTSIDDLCRGSQSSAPYDEEDDSTASGEGMARNNSGERQGSTEKSSAEHRRLVNMGLI